MLPTVIASSSDRAEWLAACAATVPGDWISVAVPGFELGKLEWVFENTNLDRFLFVQDSVQIRSQALYARLSASTPSVALLGDPRPFGCYLGVYDRKTLAKVGFPNIRSKREAVEAEIWWTEAYVKAAGEVEVLFPGLGDDSAQGPVEYLGRQNLVIGNEYFVKYKGTWRYDQIDS